jgi:hypothetical protein
MSQIKDVFLNQIKLIIIFSKALLLNNWNDDISLLHGCNDFKWITTYENQLASFSIFLQKHEILQPLITLFEVHVVLLVNNELNVDVWLRKFLVSN